MVPFLFSSYVLANHSLIILFPERVTEDTNHDPDQQPKESKTCLGEGEVMILPEDKWVDAKEEIDDAEKNR